MSDVPSDVVSRPAPPGLGQPGRGPADGKITSQYSGLLTDPVEPELSMISLRQRMGMGSDDRIRYFPSNVDAPMQRACKIIFDLAAAAFLVCLLAPVILLIAALVSADGGSVFYAQERIGLGGRKFRCLKFRSMCMNAPEILERLLASDGQAAAEWAATRKLRRDPRVTRVGRFLRHTSLDEIPQLLNVLRLDMSLVGPRPIVQAETEWYQEEFELYVQVRPGLTGLWQVSGRSDTTYAQRVRLDSWYVRNWTFWVDVVILLKTVPAVFGRSGAY